jgi:predicted regulator of Ras-like GTPase activity (Roadblock/LC7/MglB family)
VQTVLNQLNALPGVVGSLVCDADGQVLAQAFPPAFEPASLLSAAQAVAEATAGLETVTGEAGLLDLRYAQGRMVVRRLADASLLLLCAPSMNLQPVAISVSAALPRLEKLLARRGEPGSAPSPGSGPGLPPRPPGRLFVASRRIEELIARRRLDPFEVRGAIALRAGFGLGFIDADTPDDPEQLARLEAAAAAVLGEPL